ADAAADRARCRASQRRVSRPRAHGAHTASMRIEGPAGDILALDVALHAAARAAKTNGDQRTIDQLRFDALASIAHQALTTGHLATNEQDQGCTLPLARQHGHRPTIMITIPLNQLLPNWQPPTNTNTAPDQGVRAGQCIRADEGDRADQGTMAGQDTATSQAPHDQIPTWPPPLPGQHLPPPHVPPPDRSRPLPPPRARPLA